MAEGRRARTDAEGRTSYEVIGVVRDGKYVTASEQPRLFAFFAYPQKAPLALTLHGRTRGYSGATLAQVRASVRAIDPNIAVDDDGLLAELVAVSLVSQRVAAMMIGFLGLLGLTLAAIGMYGVLSTHVAQRSREFGIRLAIGMHPGALLRFVIVRGGLLTAAGLLIGLALAGALTRMLRAFLSNAARSIRSRFWARQSC